MASLTVTSGTPSLKNNPVGSENRASISITSLPEELLIKILSSAGNVFASGTSRSFRIANEAAIEKEWYDCIEPRLLQDPVTASYIMSFAPVLSSKGKLEILYRNTNPQALDRIFDVNLYIEGNKHKVSIEQAWRSFHARLIQTPDLPAANASAVAIRGWLAPRIADISKFDRLPEVTISSLIIFLPNNLLRRNNRLPPLGG